MSEKDFRDIPSQLIAAFRAFTSLIEGELSLARAEMSRNISRAGTGLIFFGVAALLSLVALNVLAQALVGFLASTSLSLGVAALLVGGALLAVAVVLALIGRARLSADALKPSRTMENISRDINRIKEASHVGS